MTKTQDPTTTLFALTTEDLDNMEFVVDAVVRGNDEALALLQKIVDDVCMVDDEDEDTVEIDEDGTYVSRGGLTFRTVRVGSFVMSMQDMREESVNI
jgi:hypothetical protein